MGSPEPPRSLWVRFLLNDAGFALLVYVGGFVGGVIVGTQL
jgi:hypothetical protein